MAEESGVEGAVEEEYSYRFPAIFVCQIRWVEEKRVPSFDYATTRDTGKTGQEGAPRSGP